MTISEIRFLRVNKAGVCGVCQKRRGSKSERLIVRFAVFDQQSGARGLGICKSCLTEWLVKLLSQKQAERLTP